MSDVAGVFRSSCHSPVTACRMLSGTRHSAGRSFPGIAVFGGAKLGFAVFRGADFAGKALTGRSSWQPRQKFLMRRFDLTFRLAAVPQIR